MIEKTIKSLINAVILIAIFILYAAFSQLVVFALKEIGFDINALNTTYKTICLIGIDIILILIVYLIYRKGESVIA